MILLKQILRKSFRTSNVTIYRINIHNFYIYVYIYVCVCIYIYTHSRRERERLTSNKNLEVNLKINFILTALKRIKHLGIKFTKVQDLYTENYKILLKERKNLNKWREISHWWSRKLKIVKMAILPKLSYMFNKISIKISAGYFSDKIEKLTPLDFKTYYKV